MFGRCKPRKDGLWPICKECRHKERAETYANNPKAREQAQQRAAKWFAEHPEQAKANRKRLYYQDRELNIAKTREWREKHPEEYRAQQHEYMLARYRARPQECVTNTRNRRARLRNAPGKHTVEDVRRLYDAQEGLCYWCKKPLNGHYDVDHVIPVSRGGSNDPSNLVLACKHCNSSKNDSLPDEWRPIP